ncbi:MAG: glycine-rich domain-containing protein [Blastopirellula sp. JB062]
MNQQQLELWRKIESFSIDEGDERLTFVKRLARENGWTCDFAERVVLEYKRFVFLAAVSDSPVTPSVEVDQAWHLHLVYTRSYWTRMCQQVLKRPLHHGPTKGGAGEAAKFVDWYERTKRNYVQFFGIAPPCDIWPESDQRFDPSAQMQMVNVGANWILPKPSLRVASLAGGVPCVVGAVAWPTLWGALQLSPVTKVVIVVFVAIFVIGLISLLIKSGRNSGGGCDSGCGGGWFFWGDSDCSSDSGCGSSCGGD